jgi:pimeloyl-ACP methyl ester carboxylesterase
MTENYEHISVITNGIRLHVVTAGDPFGKAVVLLHGFPEFWYGWRHQIPALVSAGYRVITPDQRGYNLSDKPVGVAAYNIDELSRDVIGLLDHFGIEQTCLAGHDWGAAVAWNIALNYPRRIEHLAILNVPHPAVMLKTLQTSPRQMIKSWYIGFFQIPWLADRLLRVNHFSALNRMLISSGKAGTFTPDNLVEYNKAWAQAHALTAMLNWYRAAFRERNFWQSEICVHVPTLILWGKHDVALSVEMAQKSIQLCESGRLVFFENATHWVQHDEPDEVNRQLIAFFKGR